jgi:hypothetical protein
MEFAKLDHRRTYGGGWFHVGGFRRQRYQVIYRRKHGRGVVKIPLNFELMKNPYNWVIIVLMVAIAGFAVALIFNVEPSPEQTT